MRIKTTKTEFQDLLVLYLYNALNGTQFDEEENQAEFIENMRKKGINSFLKKFYAKSETKARVNIKRLIESIEKGDSVGIDIYQDKIPTAMKYLS